MNIKTKTSNITVPLLFMLHYFRIDLMIIYMINGLIAADLLHSPQNCQILDLVIFPCGII